jgi:hypothetical protein
LPGVAIEPRTPQNRTIIDVFDDLPTLISPEPYITEQY